VCEKEGKNSSKKKIKMTYFSVEISIYFQVSITISTLYIVLLYEKKRKKSKENMTEEVASSIKVKERDNVMPLMVLCTTMTL
jgi:hypothetical protein